MENNYYEKYVGTLLDGKYRIEKCLGVGGMAVVFLAKNTENGACVAIKMLREEYAEDKEALSRFESESRAVSMLSHPNVVGIHDISITGEVKYLVMEYVEGVSLRAYMDKRGKLSLAEVSSISEQILAALNHAHSRGVIHRDIKPQNIMLLKDGFVKVMDFGIAKLPESDAATITDKAIGTVYYISPEQAAGKPSDTRADLYSVGVLMYEMATGMLPFDDERPVSVVMMQIHDKPVPPRRIDRKIPRGLEAIILSAMEKNPKKRYQTALDMLRELRRLRRNASAEVLSPKKLKRKKRTDKNLRENPPSTSVTPVILGVAFALFFVGLVVLFYTLDSLMIGGIASKSVRVPDVVGVEYTTNEELGFDADFNVQVEYEFSSTVPKGTIISQEPSGGANRKSPCSVSLVISSGPELITLGDYTIMDWRQAYIELRALNFIVTKVEEPNSAVPQDHVFATEPKAGSQLEVGSNVTIYISTAQASEIVSVPDFFGMTEKQAKEALKENSLLLGEVTYTRSSRPAGTVVYFTPAAGTEGYSHAVSVDFVISGGKSFDTVFYPDVTALGADAAKTLLENCGITVFVSTVISTMPEGTVLAQAPVSGAHTASTVTATITVSGGSGYVAPDVALPSFAGLSLDSAKLGIEALGLSVGTVTYKKNALPAGTVLGQSPAAGTMMTPGVPESRVDLVVSGGPSFIPPTITTTVPKITGMSLDAAMVTLEKYGIVIRNITYSASNEPDGTVLWQSASAGSLITGPDGEIPIDVVVSRHR